MAAEKITPIHGGPLISRPNDLLEAAQAEAAALPPLMLELAPEEVLALMGNLQLALRHPKNNGASARVARAIARKLQDHLRGPNLEIVTDMGWHKELDQQ